MTQISAKRVLSLVVLMGVVVFLNHFSRSNCDKKSEMQKKSYVYDLKEENLNEFLNWINKISEAREQGVLLKTLQFQLNHTKAEDEQLVAFVRSLVHPPFPASERNLSDKARTDFSQIGQSKHIDSLLGSRRDGFFVEAGGYNGEGHSNSLFFELNRNWEGILIEPNNTNFNKIVSEKTEQDANRKTMPHNFVVAQLVLLDKKSFLLKNTKLAPHWSGPHKIVRLKHDNNIKLKLKTA